MTHILFEAFLLIAIGLFFAGDFINYQENVQVNEQ